MKKIYLVCFIIIILLIFCSCSPNLSLEAEYEILVSNNTPILNTDVLFAYGSDDLSEVIGASDYVFIAKVTSYNGTINDTPSGIPLTVYKIIIYKNIKGNLITNTEIELLKFGGLSENRKKKIIIMGDTIPEINRYYYFSVCATDNGEIRAEGIKSNVLIVNSQNFNDDPQYQDYIDAYENEIILDRIRFKSKYEQN